MGNRRRITIITAVAACTLALAGAGNAMATGIPRYTVVDLGTFGGPSSFQTAGRPLTNGGAAIGYADTSTPDPFAPICFTDCFVAPGFVWQHGALTDLGALPGGNSSCPTWISDNGLIAGVSGNGIDATAGSLLGVAVLWRDGTMIDLGTLGGNSSDAGAVNDEGQVVGTALNAVSDPAPDSAGVVADTNCAVAPINTTEARAYVWDNGVMRDLGTLGGPDAGANFINDAGQIAGQSFTNSTVSPVTGFPTLDPFLWQHGEMIDLGTLGGAFGEASWLTQSGVVVGTSDLAGDNTFHAFRWDGALQDLGTLGGPNSQAFFANQAGDVVGRADISPSSPDHNAFLWRDGKMIDLGTVDGGPDSTAEGINSSDQIVGEGSGNHGWIWQDGQIHDLNTLTVPGTTITVLAATAINDRGEIYGTGELPNGDQHAILLIPND
jgi:probable HAF family extracellular repeat protein